MKWFLLGLIHVYQTFVSPALPRSCKYYPSCSQYAVDALTQYGAVRGVILAGWRLLRCNPLSYGGYDPVEAQTLFRPRGSRAQRADRDGLDERQPQQRYCAVEHDHAAGHRHSGGRGSGSRGGSGPRHAGGRRGRRPSFLRMVALLVLLLMLVSIFASSCSFFPSSTTTASTTVTTVSGTTGTTGAGSTTSTTVKGKSAGFLAGPLKPLEALFFWVLEKFHYFVSWSWAIVLLTVVVRIILIPLTWRQLKSMRAMQRLQPQIKELQEKYKNDRQLLNQKTMEFYQENKVSPFSSCLPLILQLPVFFGLYYMLNTAGQSGLDPASAGRWAGIFVNPTVGWLWIHDITKFDYILMFVYMASQFVASWQTARNSPGQQKMIAYFMPIMVGIFMFIGKWPAGLFIYWVTSNIWTIAQQYVAEKLMPMPVPVTAGGGGARPTAARVTGSRPAGSRPAGGGGKGVPAKTTPSKPSPGKVGASKTPPGKRPPGKQPGPGKAAPGKSTPADAPPAKGIPGKTTPGQAPSGKRPPGKSGGKSSGQTTGKQGQATTGQSKRPDGGAGGPEGSS